MGPDLSPPWRFCKDYADTLSKTVWEVINESIQII